MKADILKAAVLLQLFAAGAKGLDAGAITSGVLLNHTGNASPDKIGRKVVRLTANDKTVAQIDGVCRITDTGMAWLRELELI